MTHDPLIGLRSIPSMPAAEMTRWIEYEWLTEIRRRLRVELDELVKVYGPLGGDENVENGIGNLEAALDDLGRRADALDEGE
jgi:hypothetical protein